MTFERSRGRRGGRSGDRNRNRVRTADLLGGTPAAPISVEEATALGRKAAEDPLALRRALWDRIQRQAAAVVGQDLGAELEPPTPPAQAPSEETARATQAALVDRLSRVSFKGFERLAEVFFERKGCTDLAVLMRRDHSLLLTLNNPSGVSVLALLRQVTEPTEVSTLTTLQRGSNTLKTQLVMVISLGGFTDAMQQSALRAESFVELLDGAAFAQALWDHRVGVDADGQLDESVFARWVEG